MPPSEVTSTVWVVTAAMTATSPAHQPRPAGRTNHPEMSLLPVAMGATLGPRAPVEADQHTPCPV
ncbi:hypothetical protein GCM10010233_06610 [Streptomyces pseudogriseolus]|nr:hypothetical protein GCM10010233_06610 [Streptomyces gancidicus]